jgi:hypothetical protein
VTSIRFVGDLPLWAGLLAAVIAGLGAWRFYRRESYDLPGRLRWALPALRTAAIVLTVMILAGPVLHHRRVIGQLGRVLIFCDASQSMSVADPHMPPARKLLVARQQGWLPPGEVDLSLPAMADRLGTARRSVAGELQGQTVDAASLQQCRRTFAREVGEVAALIDRYDWDALLAGSGGDASAPWSGLRERFQSELLQPAEALAAESLDGLESRQDVASRLTGLCESAAGFENALTGAFDEYGSRLASSGKTQIASALAMFDRMSRWSRLENWLLDPSAGLLRRLARTHDVELFALSGSEAEPLWSSRDAASPPEQLAVEPLGHPTDLATALTGELAEQLAAPSPAARAEGEAPGQRTAVILLTDGRHNSGPSPLETPAVLGDRGIPLFPVSFGCRREPPDLALVEVQHPEMVFQKDQIRGTLVIKDQMPPGQSFTVRIGQEGETLWQEQLTTQNVPLRRVEFEFSIDELVERLRARFDSNVRHYALPLSLEASIAPLEGEADLSNNQRTMRFMAITRSYKLLLIDGRSRWETRYVRNVFQRDEQWNVDTILVGPASEEAALPRGDGPDRFPADEAALFDYDLIIFGEVPPGVLADGERRWIRNFVERRGGGMIFIDGRSGYLRALDEETLAPLLPVSWLPGGVDALPTRLQLTEEGAKQSAFVLKSTGKANEEFWQELPPPHRPVLVEALPGTEVFVEAVVGQETHPVMVTRSFGAGRVLYNAFDETWRWRYKVADTYHQRFWNQVAKWVMERPFAVSDEYVSLDSGPCSYQSGEIAEIRVRLRGLDGRPLSDATVDGLLWRDGRIASTVSLAADAAGHGLYRGRTAPLSEGQYEVSVRAAGFSNEALKARTSFVVLAPESGEMQQIACHDELLEEMALASGGRFLREEELVELPELLSPLSSGYVVESDTLLWQSYWWFTLIVGLLAIEWMLRKRAGLL